MNELFNALDYDKGSGDFRWRKTVSSKAVEGFIAGTINPDGYRQIKYKGRCYLAHRLAYFFVNGHIPDEKQIDHIDRNRLNNSISNLRIVTNRENHKNRSLNRRNKVGLSGVRFNQRLGKWQSFINGDSKQLYLGSFSGFLDACCARKSAENYYSYASSEG